MPAKVKPKPIEVEQGFAKNQFDMSRIVSERLGISCNRMTINRWIWREGAPKPRDDGSMEIEPMLSWVVERKTNGALSNGEEDDPMKLLKMEELQISIDKKRGKFMEKSEHNRILASLGKETWGGVCDLVERDLLESLEAKLRGILPDDQLAAFMAERREAHRQGIDALQRRFSEKIKENEK